MNCAFCGRPAIGTQPDENGVMVATCGNHTVEEEGDDDYPGCQYMGGGWCDADVTTGDGTLCAAHRAEMEKDRRVLVILGAAVVAALIGLVMQAIGWFV